MASRYKPARVFTADQANATLPLVRAITRDMVELARYVTERQQRFEHLRGGRELASGDPYGDELAHTERELERDREKLRGYVEELQQLGVEPKSATEGLVDFPSVLDGRLVYLCWRHGEPEILFWHELDEGFGGRQPLTADAAEGGRGEGETGPCQAH